MPLITEFGSDRVEIRMFHTPNLTGLRKKVIPNRINEGWGLQHMKLYGVDEELHVKWKGQEGHMKDESHKDKQVNVRGFADEKLEKERMNKVVPGE